MHQLITSAVCGTVNVTVRALYARVSIEKQSQGRARLCARQRRKRRVSFSHEAPSGATGCFGRTHLQGRVLFLSAAPGWFVLTGCEVRMYPTQMSWVAAMCNNGFGPLPLQTGLVVVIPPLKAGPSPDDCWDTLFLSTVGGISLNQGLSLLAGLYAPQTGWDNPRASVLWHLLFVQTQYVDLSWSVQFLTPYKQDSSLFMPGRPFQRR